MFIDDGDQRDLSEETKKRKLSHALRRMSSHYIPSVNVSKDFEMDPIKMSRYMQSYNKGIQDCVDLIHSFDFNIFQLRKVSSGRELLIMGYEIA